MALVTSTEAHANIISVAPSRALQMAGVVDYISAADVPGTNLFGPIERTEEVFATEEVSDFLEWYLMFCYVQLCMLRYH